MGGVVRCPPPTPTSSLCEKHTSLEVVQVLDDVVLDGQEEKQHMGNNASFIIS